MSEQTKGGISTPLMLVIIPILLTIMLGSIFNAANNSLTYNLQRDAGLNDTTDYATNYAYSAHFNIAKALLNPQSPFTFLIDRDIMGFLTHLIGTAAKPTDYVYENTQYAFKSCTNEGDRGYWIYHLLFFNCVAPSNWPYQTDDSAGHVEFDCYTSTAPNANLANGKACLALHASYGNLAIAMACTPANSAETKIEQVQNGEGINCVDETGNTGAFATTGTGSTGDTLGTAINPVINGVLSFAGFAVGGILLILALGLHLSAATVTIAANTQGTRLAQSLGITLILWGMASSEFGIVWLAFPFGSGAVIQIILTAIICLGAFEMARRIT